MTLTACSYSSVAHHHLCFYRTSRRILLCHASKICCLSFCQALPASLSSHDANESLKAELVFLRCMSAVKGIDSTTPLLFSTIAWSSAGTVLGRDSALNSEVLFLRFDADDGWGKDMSADSNFCSRPDSSEVLLRLWICPSCCLFFLRGLRCAESSSFADSRITTSSRTLPRHRTSAWRRCTLDIASAGASSRWLCHVKWARLPKCSQTASGPRRSRER